MAGEKQECVMEIGLEVTGTAVKIRVRVFVSAKVVIGYRSWIGGLRVVKEGQREMGRRSQAT